MAGNKINTKKREDKSKTVRSTNQGNEDAEDIDFSILRKPIISSVTGFSQARKIFDVATEEIKGLISNECDILYECKVCRNIFRSLVNFISHKRIYCREKFNASEHGHFVRPTSLVNEINRLNKLEENYRASIKTKNEEDDESNDRIPLTKDLSEVIERIAKRKAVQDSVLDKQQVILQKIPKNTVAVYQSVNYEGQKTDSLRSQVQELNKITSMENAVLQKDGKFKIQNNLPTDPENVIQISDDDDDDDDEDIEDNKVHECKECDLQFTTLKTLKYHMKHKHLENRLVFPCPDCLAIFSTSWSVYRHLFKIHRKTAAQIRRLRESIQSKAFRMNNPPAFYEKRKNNIKNITHKKTEEERLDQENQEWMDNMEGDGELPRCGGCGRTFARLAALVAHTNTCQPRSRALARRPQETKKIEIQIRKDYNKGPQTSMVYSKSDETKDDSKEAPVAKPVSAKDTEENKLSEAVMTVIGDKDENMEIDKDTATIENTSKEKKDTSQENKDTPQENKDTSQENKDTSQESIDASQENKDMSQEKKDMSQENKFLNRLPYTYGAEKRNLDALKQKMSQDVELNNFLCKKCNTKLDDKEALIDHMANHYKWIRYGCKLCNFKHYEFDKLPEHIKIVHKLKGDSDFYYSTVKAIDSPEALEISELADDVNEATATNPGSRRPSRCSSDSSRVSDDSSSSSVRIEGSRKRKMNRCRTNIKKIKDSPVLDKSEDTKEEVKAKIIENDSSPNSKTFEENSSDMDDIETDKSTKFLTNDKPLSVATRRPVRKKTKPKNEDFEYDLSNLLKMEAQGYRDSLLSSNKTYTSKKKVQDIQNVFDNLNKDFTGALITMSRKSVEKANAVMKNTSFVFNSSKSSRIVNVFAKPYTPKISKIDKSPKKDATESTNDHSPVKEAIQTETITVDNKDISKTTNASAIENENEKTLPMPDTIPVKESISENNESPDCSKNEADNNKESETNDTIPIEKDKSNTSSNVNVPQMFPFKFGRGIDVMKNPLIKKNLTDFTKAGMKTKILVIKPINRNKDGTTTLNTPLKFQTIKIKDPNKDYKANEEKKSDQSVVVPVPKSECAIRPSSSLSSIDKSPIPTTAKSLENKSILNTNTILNDKSTENDSSEPSDTKGTENSDIKEQATKVLTPENTES